MITTYAAAPGIDVLTSSFPIPGFGFVPINAFVLHGREPLLVDTGAVVQGEEFMTALRSVIDPRDLKWVWLTHPDFDHIGSLSPLLDANPDIRVITTFLAVGIMSLFAPLPMDRVHLVNPGQNITIGERTLTAWKAPAFDNPSTTGFLDDASGALLCSDCFGALLADVPTSAADLSGQELRQGQVLWATIDSPWLHNVDRAGFATALDRVRHSEPTTILSSHLPAAPGTMIDQFIRSLEAVPAAIPFHGPDQVALQAMLTQMKAPLSQ
jgi:flavorubredoxin